MPARPIRVALAAAVLSAGFTTLQAEAAPLATTLYLRQTGCGSTAEPGRLEEKKGIDDATGCGGIGGVPFNEVFYTVDGGVELEQFTTTAKFVPFVADGARKVTGQISTSSWLGDVGGVGTVVVDLTLSVRTAAGRTISLGSKTITAQADPTKTTTSIPFEFTLPAAANRQKITSVTLGMIERGANVNASARQLDGMSYVVIPKRLR